MEAEIAHPSALCLGQVHWRCALGRYFSAECTFPRPSALARCALGRDYLDMLIPEQHVHITAIRDRPIDEHLKLDFEVFVALNAREAIEDAGRTPS
ncbi:unnamed protein product [Linum trigynum]|uniref:Uncharacterized protein n=1 Tax=Linum trigynum TaxID=586398 RepID=A0AAV2CG95_9ROSI